MSLKIYLANDLPGRHIIHYTLQLIAFNKGAEFTYVPSPSDADLHVSGDERSDIPLCLPFYQNLTLQDYDAVRQMTTKGGLYFNYFRSADDLAQDPIASIFYLVNCIQEHEGRNFDKYGRYPYHDSIQYRSFGLPTNAVQSHMDILFERHPVFSKLPAQKRKSGFFLTHDIDTIYGAKNQNGDYALKNHLYHRIPGLLWRHYMGQPDWLNMDRIMAMEERYGFRSTFYWLVAKDKKNADYDIEWPAIVSQMHRIEQKGFDNGLHKSVNASSMDDERERLHTLTQSQRYHFLRFTLPDAWEELEGAGFLLDTSLGFSENFGFRNSYGLPFMPYNIKEKRVYDLIEVPMNVMDGNFFYQGKTVAQAEQELIDWLDANKENTIITINFHNNFFDDMLYAGYEQLYDTLLRYFKEEKLTCMTPSSLIKEFHRPELFTL